MPLLSKRIYTVLCEQEPGVWWMLFNDLLEIETHIKHDPAFSREVRDTIPSWDGTGVSPALATALKLMLSRYSAGS